MNQVMLIATRIFSEASAINCDEVGGTTEVCQTGLPSVGAGTPQIQLILQWTFAIIGVIAVVVIMYAGFRLIIARGDNPDAVKRARNTIITAAVGLIIAISAEIIISVLIDKI